MYNTVKNKKNKHLNHFEIELIERKLKQGLKQSEISKLLDRSRSTISREIRRGTILLKNSDLSDRQEYSGYYSSILRYEKKSKTGRKKSARIIELLPYIQDLLKKKYSPDVISGILKKELSISISRQTIYNYISNKELKYKYSYKRKSKKELQEKRGSYRNNGGNSIEERPFHPSVRRFGDWEMDTVLGKRGSKAALLVLTNRYSRLELIMKMKDKTQVSVANVLNKIEKKLQGKFQEIFKTITVDNGSEFINHKLLETSILNSSNKRTNIYYAHPYSAYERGSNENNNKLIRKFIDKNADISKISNKRILDIQNWINNYPRKLFNYMSANDIFIQALMQ